MTLLAIIVLLIVFKAWKDGRPLKLVLSEEEARAVKARWWTAARRELKIWAICFVIGSALFAATLQSANWHPGVYVALAWGSLVLFSRLAIWIGLGVGLVALVLEVITSTLGHPMWPSWFVMGPIITCLTAIVIRFFVSCGGLSALAGSARIISEQHGRTVNEADEDPVYDVQTDENVYSSGRREPAFLRPYDEPRNRNRD
jgi:hypothetical protein